MTNVNAVSANGEGVPKPKISKEFRSAHEDMTFHLSQAMDLVDTLDHLTWEEEGRFSKQITLIQITNAKLAETLKAADAVWKAGGGHV